MSKILIIYSTTDGHTREICRRLRQVIEQQDIQTNKVEIVSINDGQDIELDNYDKIVVVKDALEILATRTGANAGEKAAAASAKEEAKEAKEEAKEAEAEA